MPPSGRTRANGLHNLLSKLELAPSPPDQVLLCSCDELCPDWAEHPIGRVLRGPEADEHWVKRAEAALEQDRDQPDFNWKVARRLVLSYRREADEEFNESAYLVAKGETACSLGDECYTTQAHFLEGQDGVCVLHKEEPDKCVKCKHVPIGDNPHPFAYLGLRPPVSTKFDFALHYRWQDHCPAPAQPAAIDQLPSPTYSSQTTHTLDSPSTSSTTPTPATHHTRSPSLAPPPKRARLAPAPSPALNPDRQRLLADFEARLAREQEEDNRRLAEEARQTEAREALDTTLADARARLDACQAEEDAVKGREMYEAWIGEQAEQLSGGSGEEEEEVIVVVEAARIEAGARAESRARSMEGGNAVAGPSGVGRKGKGHATG